VTIYYQGPDVVITHEVFAVRTPTPQRFHIRELRQVHVVRGDLPPERMVTVHVAAGAFVAALVMAPVLDSPFALLVTATTAVSAMGANGLCVRLRPRTYEIRAIYQALDVCLYRSADLRTFGQVRRALMRALERSEEADFNNWGTTLGAKAS
jgi:Family of unknown function (DUF6232)